MIPDWIRRPESILTIVLFLLSIPLALYGSEIRRGLSAPRRFVSNWAKNRATEELNTLVHLHNNSYELVLYLAYELVQTTIFTFRFFAAYAIVVVVLIITKSWGLKDLHLINFGSMLLGGMLGRSIWVFDILKGLYQYEKRTAELRGRLGIESSPSS